jgi:L-lactate dehydrogenase complex protein LldG
MSEARNAILNRLRGAGSDTYPDAEPAPPPPIAVRRFDWDPQARLCRFRQMLESVRGEVHVTGDEWPETLARLLRQKGVGTLRYGTAGPLAAELRQGWPAAGPRLVPHDGPIEDCRDALFRRTDAGFTSCRAAIAETGSLVLWPTPAEPRLLSLVPPVHCVLLDADSIFSTLHELMVAQCWHRGMPTNALLISGPSKSADIEQTLAYGVHGPAQLFVLVRRSGEPASAGDPPTPSA